jgi:hypothetical protein
MRELRRQRGVTLSGLIFACVFIGVVAVLAMRLFPLYNEKLKVDSAMENVAAQPNAATMTKTDVVRAMLRNFEVSDVDRFDTPTLSKVLTVETERDSRDKVVNVQYEIRGPLFGQLDIVLKYDKTVTLAAGVSE